jgi:hypothetical protein
MPSLGTHLASARLLADRLAHRHIEADRGAYYLGATAPDVRLITRGEREETHFFKLDEFEEQDSIARMLATHPRLADPSGLSTETRAFMAGYLTHLLLDERYIERIYRSFFGAASKFGDDPRGNLLDRVLQYELDRREREDGALAGVREAMAETTASPDLDFIARETLQRWQEAAVDMASHPPTWDRFVHTATRHLDRSEEEAERLAREVPDLLRDTLDHVTQERVEAFLDESTQAAAERVREYLQ